MVDKTVWLLLGARAVGLSTTDGETKIKKFIVNFFNFLRFFSRFSTFTILDRKSPPLVVKDFIYCVKMFRASFSG